MAYKILALCGGGIRGIISARILERLYQLDHDLLSQATVLAGTSTGCDIISYHLAKKTAPEIFRIYRDEAWLFFVDGKKDPSRPAYSIQKLADQQDKLHPPTMRLRDVPGQHVVMTAFDIVQWRPVIFNSFPKSDTLDDLLTDAVVSSSAMPGMFGAWKGKIDGAFVSHDPSLAALSCALGLSWDGQAPRFEDISIICIGTGLMKNWVHEDATDWGANQMQYAKDVPIMGADFNVYPLFINGGPSITGNASLNGTSTDVTQMQMRHILGDKRYAYLDAVLDRFVPENETNQQTLDYIVAQADKVDLGHALEVIAAHWG